MVILRLARRGWVVAVLLLTSACAAATPAPIMSPTAAVVASPTTLPPSVTATVAPTRALAATQAVTHAPTLAPSRTPEQTATVAAEPTGTPLVATGQVLSIDQIIDLTFIDSRQGWLLAAGPCLGQVCPVTMRQTHDGGQTWAGLPAPAAHAEFFPSVFTRPAGGAAEVSSVRFATPLDGWAFGPSFYSTHDGGQTWRDEQRTVTSMAIVNGAVWAVEQQATMPVVMRSTNAGQTWTPSTMQPLLIGWPYVSSVNAQTAWLFTQDSVLNPQLLVTNNGGDSWSELHMPLRPCLTSMVKPVTPVILWFICGSSPGTNMQTKQVYTSSDGGVLWQLRADNETTAPTTGQIASTGVLLRSSGFAAPSASTAFMALSRGTLIMTQDGGGHWVDAIAYARANGGSDPAMGPVVFANARNGWLAAGPNRLFRTTDGGHNWTETTVQ